MPVPMPVPAVAGFSGRGQRCRCKGVRAATVELDRAYRDPGVPDRELVARLWRYLKSEESLAEQVLSPTVLSCMEIFARRADDGRGARKASCLQAARLVAFSGEASVGVVLASRVRALREDAGLSRKKLAGRLEIYESFLFSVERQKANLSLGLAGSRGGHGRRNTGPSTVVKYVFPLVRRAGARVDGSPYRSAEERPVFGPGRFVGNGERLWWIED